MSISDMESMREHIGHNIVCVRYGQDDECINVAIECETCGCVLIDCEAGETISKDDPDTIAHVWHIDDVIGQAKDRDIEVSEEQAREILHRIDSNKDATIGINWDVLNYHTDSYLNGDK